jgi:DNA-binding MarR family transcriptional regulator
MEVAMAEAGEDWQGPAGSTGVLLWRTANRWQRDVRAALTEHGLTQTQFLLLSALAAFDPDGPRPTQARLAASCGIDVAVASQGLRRLQRDRLVRRRTGSDARARELELTDAGRALVARANPDIAAVDAAFFARLGSNREAFAGALRALIGLRLRVAAGRQPAP